MINLILILFAAFSFVHADIKIECNSIELNEKKCELQNKNTFIKLTENWIELSVGKKVSSIEFPNQGSQTEWIDASIESIDKVDFLMLRLWENPDPDLRQNQVFYYYQVDKLPAKLVAKKEVQTRKPAKSNANKWILGPKKKFKIEKQGLEYKLVELKSSYSK